MPSGVDEARAISTTYHVAETRCFESGYEHCLDIRGINGAKNKHDRSADGLLRRLAASRLGLNVEELASGFEVSSKTIRRDLERFRSAGFPLGGVLCFDEAFALALSVTEGIGCALSDR
ncbi:DeoR family transcriptional regulator [Neorhodopirellula pilleata]|uniref:DeoR-like helix-turn-helix domain protein n=1 Tax=Neorhodopirellula pilleata TaxID=2714738 RepID=A0A5C6AX27_9BACT|nr:DeoR-like helix-turn-helix domain protein [Neorhodopirellula pilleata]